MQRSVYTSAKRPEKLEVNPQGSDHSITSVSDTAGGNQIPSKHSGLKSPLV